VCMLPLRRGVSVLTLYVHRYRHELCQLTLKKGAFGLVIVHTHIPIGLTLACRVNHPGLTLTRAISLVFTLSRGGITSG